MLIYLFVYIVFNRGILPITLHAYESANNLNITCFQNMLAASGKKSTIVEIQRK